MTDEEYKRWERQGKILLGIMIVGIVIGVPLIFLIILSWLQ